MRALLFSLLAFFSACAAQQAPRPPVAKAASPAPIPAPPVLGPHGERVLLAIGAREGDGAPSALTLFVDARGPRLAVAYERATAVELLTLREPKTAPEQLPLAPFPGRSGAESEVHLERLIAVGGGNEAPLVVVGAAGSAYSTQIVGAITMTFPASRACGLAGRAALLADRNVSPHEPERATGELFFLPFEGEASTAISARQADGQRCSAVALSEGGYLLAWIDEKGALLTRPIDAQGRAAAATRTIAAEKNERLGSPVLAQRQDGGVLLVATSRGDGSLRSVQLSTRGVPSGALRTIAKLTSTEIPSGVAIAPLADGGFALAFHVVEDDGVDAPAELRLVRLDASGAARGEPMVLLRNLVATQNPAAIVADGERLFVGGIAREGGQTEAQIVELPLP